MNDKHRCLFCGEEITENDEAVECLYCEGIYHKECRENIPGCVVPGCYASDEKVNSDALEEMEEIEETEEFEEPDKKEEPVYSNRGLSAFYADSKEYYDREFDKIRNGKMLSWNWAAFFLSIPWLLYRKMYPVALLFMLLSDITDIISEIFPNLNILMMFVDLLLALVLGFTANRIYYGRVNKLYSKAQDMTGKEKADFISKKGGSSVAGAIALILAYSVVSVLFLMLFTGL